MGSITLASPFSSLQSAIATENISPYGMGSPATKLKYTGNVIDFTLGPVGDPQNNAFSACPADAVALEVWANGAAADDYLFVATLSGKLSAAGVLATNVANNLNTSRYAVAGGHLVIPFQAVGAVPAGFRFAGSKNGARLQGRYVSSSSNLKYKLSGATSTILLTGADTSQQLPYGSVAYFPGLAAQAAVDLMVAGTSGLAARFTLDGTVPSATVGDIVPVGSHLFIDAADHGIAWSSLKIFLPTGVNVAGTTYDYI